MYYRNEELDGLFTEWCDFELWRAVDGLKGPVLMPVRGMCFIEALAQLSKCVWV